MSEAVGSNNLQTCNESTSMIEKKQSLNDSSSFDNSLGVCIELLKVNNGIANGRNDNGNNDYMYQCKTLRSTLSNNLIRNKYISPSIKHKMNEIMIDSNANATKQPAYLALYQSHSTKGTFVNKYIGLISNSTNSLINKHNEKMLFDKEVGIRHALRMKKNKIVKKIDLSIPVYGNNSNQRQRYDNSKTTHSSVLKNTSHKNKKLIELYKDINDIEEFKSKLNARSSNISIKQPLLPISLSVKNKHNWLINHYHTNPNDKANKEGGGGTYREKTLNLKLHL